MSRAELIDVARAARKQAYAPYSRFEVGAALRVVSGRVYTGCNVENISYGLTICAERVAIFKAVSEGEREFKSLAVVTENGLTPCGACRQVLVEFGPSMEIIIARSEGDWCDVYSVADLLPHSPESLR